MIPRVLWRCAKPRNGRTKKPKRPRQSLTTKDTKVHEGVAASKGATSSCSFVSFVDFSSQSMNVLFATKVHNIHNGITTSCSFVSFVVKFFNRPGHNPCHAFPQSLLQDRT